MAKKTPSRQGLYALAAEHSVKAIKVLVDIMENSKNESLKMGAAKALLDKALPDVKAMEISGENQGPIQIKIIEDTFKPHE